MTEEGVAPNRRKNHPPGRGRVSRHEGADNVPAGPGSGSPRWGTLVRITFLERYTLDVRVCSVKYVNR